jgi:sugar O-acyltransferase (sialic acid O-acetyltransferase NeuD family)
MIKKNRKLIIFGSGKFSEFIAYSFENDSEYELCAFCVEKSYLSSEINSEFDIPIVIFENIEEKFPAEHYHLFIAVGNDAVREKIHKQAKLKGYSLPNFISSLAIIPNNLKTLGENIFISEGSTLQAFVSIESNTYLLGARVGHHCIIKKNSLLSGCLVGAEVEIGENSFIGLNATIRSKIKIAKYNIIGMGANITKNTNKFEVYTSSAAQKRTLDYNDIANSFL